MADRMVERFESLGGTLLLKKEAVKVDLNGNRAESVTFSDGSTIKADYVILTGDPASEFEKLIDVPMPSALKKKYDDPRLARFSSYHCAFSCDLSELPFKGVFPADTLFPGSAAADSSYRLKQQGLCRWGYRCS